MSSLKRAREDLTPDETLSDDALEARVDELRLQLRRMNELKQEKRRLKSILTTRAAARALVDNTNDLQRRLDTGDDSMFVWCHPTQPSVQTMSVPPTWKLHWVKVYVWGYGTTTYDCRGNVEFEQLDSINDMTVLKLPKALREIAGDIRDMLADEIYGSSNLQAIYDENVYVTGTQLDHNPPSDTRFSVDMCLPVFVKEASDA